MPVDSVIIIADMVDSGLLACSETFDASACLVYYLNLPQENSGVCGQCPDAGARGLHHHPATMSGPPAILLPLHFFVHGSHPHLYLCLHPVIIVHTFDSDTNLFLFLSGYSYNVYFSIIVLKVGIKLISIIRYPSVNADSISTITAVGRSS